ncbi:hypothetical protein HYDPIDRAFT_119413 [Hydnomerulius pinastri MD-312]|uniref:Uncharacterized protein n=1 Tax=Hydnomerulius pinastri MD-312 TaxID=994086 RepID=A0A0C9VLV6_9AGAM|nr:hypothetical protein HYDPIDRAFT_119413 [Hydnomerulius pinastri MD-312]
MVRSQEVWTESDFTKWVVSPSDRCGELTGSVIALPSTLESSSSSRYIPVIGMGVQIRDQ